MRGLRSWGVFGFVFLSCLWFGQIASTQTTDATVIGQITDPSGRVAMGATVVLTNINTNTSYTTESNSEGIYRFVGLRPGIYRANVSKDGFKGIVKDTIELHVQDNVSINFALEVGSVAETVTVEAGAPTVNTESASVSTVVDRQLVDNLPLNGRSFQALINLTPGVVLTSANFATPGQFSINGQRSDANYFTVDGVSANVAASTGVSLLQYGSGVYPAFSASGGTNSLVSIDALEEFRVQSSTFAPEYGRSPGGQVSIMTRSGTNQFHGTAFEYFRNDILDANDWFANSVANKKSPLRQNDFGGVFSGPILKDRLFFFYSYEGLRLRLPQTLTESVPSINFRSNAIPAMQAILNAFPVPNPNAVEINGLQDFTGSFTNPSSLNATSLRVDYSVSKRWTLFGRYNYSPSSTETRGDPQQMISLSEVDHFKTTTQTLTLGAGTSANPRLTNEFRFNFSRVTTDSSSSMDTFGGAVPFSSSALFPSGFDFSNSLLNFNVYGLVGPGPLLSVGEVSNNLQRQLNFVDNVSYSLGTHLLKFGADYRRLSPVQHPPAYGQLVGFLDENSAQNGNAFVRLTGSRPTINFIYSNFSLFAQDTWKATPRLVLTYGLRWDFNPRPTTGESTPAPATLNGLANASTVDPATLITLAASGTPLYKNSHSDFAPRIGIAYQLRQSPNWTSVLRGGFGLFSIVSSSVFGDAAGGFPYIVQQDMFPVSFPNPSQFPPPALGGKNPPFGRISLTDPNLKSPYSLQWNTAFEQQLGANQSLSVSYVGAVGRRLIYQHLFFFPNPSFSSIFLSLNGATSDYNALQVQLHRRVTRGLQALASYTWSHTLDMDSNTEGGTVLQRGNSDFDIRHSFTMGASYELPRPNFGKLPNALLKNWTLDTSVYARSAGPVNLIGGFISFPYSFLSRPDVVPGQPFYISDLTAPGGRRINPAAFTPAPAGQQGNLGRNAIRGFNTWQADFAVRRDFPVRERLTLQFRTEIFNIFNHPNFGPPYPWLGTPQFGVPTQSLAQSLGSGGLNGGFNPLYQIGGPRSIQFALKLVF